MKEVTREALVEFVNATTDAVAGLTEGLKQLEARLSPVEAALHRTADKVTLLLLERDAQDGIGSPGTEPAATVAGKTDAGLYEQAWAKIRSLDKRTTSELVDVLSRLISDQCFRILVDQYSPLEDLQRCAAVVADIAKARVTLMKQEAGVAPTATTAADLDAVQEESLRQVSGDTLGIGQYKPIDLKDVARRAAQRAASNAKLAVDEPLPKELVSALESMQTVTKYILHNTPTQRAVEGLTSVNLFLAGQTL